MNPATSLKRSASPIAQEANLTSSSSASSSSLSSSLSSGSLGGISVAHDPSSPGSFFPRTTTTNWNDLSSSPDPHSIVEASSAKGPRPDGSYERQPSTIATSSTSSLQSTFNPLEDLHTTIVTSLSLAQAQGANRDIISGYKASLERLNQATQARNDGHTTLSSYYQRSAIALFKKSEAKAQAKNDQGLFGEQVLFHNEKAASFEQLRTLFDQAARAYENGDHQAAEEWGHQAQFFAKLSKIRGYGTFEPNDFGEQSITALKMIEMIRNNVITPEFLEGYYVDPEEVKGALSNEISKDIKTLEEKIKLVQILSEHSFETRHCLEKLKGQLVEVEERERENLTIDSNLSTQKDQIQNTITALEAILLTPMTKEKFLKFFNDHKDALTKEQDHFLFYQEESQDNTIQGGLENLHREDTASQDQENPEEPQPSIHETIENLYKKYTASQDQENSCTLTLDAAQRIRDVCLRGDGERVKGFIPALEKHTEYRSLAAEKEAQGKTQEAIYWNHAADTCLYEAGELAEDTPNNTVAAAYGKAAQYHIKAAEAEAQGKTQEADYFNNAGLMYNNQAKELAKDTPNEAVAAAYEQAAQYEVKAAEAEALGKTLEAIYWNNAGVMHNNQAEELAKDTPNDAAAAAYGQGGECYENAAKARAYAKTLEARCWNETALMYGKQADELAKNPPNDAAAAAYGQAAQYRAQAAEAEAQGKNQEAMYWNNAGVMCRKKADELAKDTPNDAAAAAYAQGGECYENAAKALAQGNDQEKDYWSNAGWRYENQALELAENPPNNAAAAAYGQGAAECYKKAAEAQALENPQDARYWEHAGVMFNKKADELAEAEPNAHSPINQYDEYVRYYTEKVDNLNTQLEENKKIHQSIREHRRRGI